MGPRAVDPGMTGSGKSRTLMSILLSLLTTLRGALVVITPTFKGWAGTDGFQHFRRWLR